MAAVDDARDLSGAAHPPEVLPFVNFYGVALKITGGSPVIAVFSTDQETAIDCNHG